MPFFTLSPVFKELKPGQKFILFICFWMIFFIFFALLSVFMARELFELPEAIAELNSKQVNQYKFIQFITSVGIFIIPPIFLAAFFTDRKWEMLKVRRFPSLNTLVLVFLILFFSLPLLNLLIEWNLQLQLPESLAYLEGVIRKMEEDAGDLTEMFLRADSSMGLVLNLFLVALIPAIGEELLFRGIFQHYLAKAFRNPHAGIWVAAFCFSLLHFQFYGFVPRLMLGVLFGYLFFWSRSLWVPIFAHLLNNASAVIVSYYSKGNNFQEEIDTIGTDTDTWYYAIPASLLLALMLRFFYRENEESKTDVVIEKE